MHTLEERRAENEARLRDANERIRRTAARLELDSPIPFLCECTWPGCMTVVHLTPAEYEHVRSHGAWFVHANGHESGPEGTTVETHPGYLIVEKRGDAEAIALETDPRA